MAGLIDIFWRTRSMIIPNFHKKQTLFGTTQLKHIIFLFAYNYMYGAFANSELLCR